MNDTIVNKDKNVVTIVNNSDESGTLDDLSIEQTPIEHYDVFQINFSNTKIMSNQNKSFERHFAA